MVLTISLEYEEEQTWAKLHWYKCRQAGRNEEKAMVLWVNIYSGILDLTFILYFILKIYFLTETDISPPCLMSNLSEIPSF